MCNSSPVWEKFIYPPFPELDGSKPGGGTDDTSDNENTKSGETDNDTLSNLVKSMQIAEDAAPDATRYIDFTDHLQAWSIHHVQIQGPCIVAAIYSRDSK